LSFEITCIRQDLDHELEAILWVNIASGCLRLQRITKEQAKKERDFNVPIFLPLHFFAHL